MDGEDRQSFCMVERGAHRLALRAAAVRRVLSGGTMTHLSGELHLVGVANERGCALPVVSLDAWLGLRPRPATSGDAVVVVESGGVRFGVLVDHVGGIAELAEPSLVGSTDALLSLDPELISGCTVGPRGAVAVLAEPALARTALTAAARAVARSRRARFDSDPQIADGRSA